jgi:hypothetical protein
MGNMSYCRFQNTAGDFRDCDEALEELIDGSGDPLSGDELAAAKSLAKRACAMVERLAEAADIDLDLSDLRKKLPELLESLNARAKSDRDGEDD